MTPEPTPPIGPNGPEVNRFLTELRGLDWDRAIQLWDGRTTAGAEGYERALGRASAVARARREDEWLVAREAASAIARETLGEGSLTEQVASVVADVAGAIVVRDLLLPLDYQLLVRPWTPRGEVIPDATPIAASAEATIPAQVPPSAQLTGLSAAALVDNAAPAAPTPVPGPPPALAPPAFAPPPMAGRGGLGVPGRAARRRSLALVAAPVVAVILALTVLASGFEIIFGPSPAPELAQATELATATLPPDVAVASPATPTFAPASITSFETDLPSALPEPSILAGATDPPNPEPTVRAEPDPTRRPPEPTERPDPPKPTKAPTAVPTPLVTAVPPPPPEPMCTVISLLDVRFEDSQETWNDAGFSGRVRYWPFWPDSYQIHWQSLAVGTSVACTSGILVRYTLP